MNLCQLYTFLLIFWPVCCVFAVNRRKSEEKSVQLTEVNLYRIYFLQNSYFSTIPGIVKIQNSTKWYKFPGIVQFSNKQ